MEANGINNNTLAQVLSAIDKRWTRLDLTRLQYHKQRLIVLIDRG
nr:MAG TPA: hypothetical protein [Caudoviricetes sp.]